MMLIVGTKNNLLCTNLENFTFFSTSTFSIPNKICWNYLCRTIKRILSDNILTMKSANWYSGFKANNPGLAKVMENATEGKEK